MLKVAGITVPSVSWPAILLTDDRPSRMPWFQQMPGGPPVTQMKIGLPSAAALTRASHSVSLQGTRAYIDSFACGLTNSWTLVNEVGQAGSSALSATAAGGVFAASRAAGRSASAWCRSHPEPVRATQAKKT